MRKSPRKRSKRQFPSESSQAKVLMEKLASESFQAKAQSESSQPNFTKRRFSGKGSRAKVSKRKFPRERYQVKQIQQSGSSKRTFLSKSSQKRKIQNASFQLKDPRRFSSKPYQVTDVKVNRRLGVESNREIVSCRVVSCRVVPCVRACVRAVWLPSGIGSQTGLRPFLFSLYGAPSFPFSLFGATSFPFPLPPTPQISYPTLVGLIGSYISTDTYIVTKGGGLTLWLCSYVALWLCDSVAIWLCGWTKKGSKRFTLKEVHRIGYELATMPD